MTSIPQWWLQAGIETDISWPDKELELVRDGLTFVLAPPAEKCLPTVSVECRRDGSDLKEKTRKILEFLSGLSWSRDGYCRAVMFTSGANRIRLGQMSEVRSRVEQRHFTTHDIPLPSTAEAKLALALYREAKGINNYAYELLTYFRIINILYGKSKDQKIWINNNVPTLTDREAMSRLNSIRATGTDVGEYLYVSGRCAVAHALAKPTPQNPVVDPDSPEDVRRMQEDLPLVRSLAERLIEVELGVKSRSTLFREHLYELEDIRQLLGACRVNAVLNGNNIDISDLMGIAFSIGLERQPTYSGLSQLRLRSSITPRPGQLILTLSGPAGRVTVDLWCDFTSGRIHFEPWSDKFLEVEDDLSVTYIDDMVSIYEFQIQYLANGCLEIRADGKVISRKDAYIPLNVSTGRSIDAWAAAAKDLKEKRDDRIAFYPWTWSGTWSV